MTPPEQRTPESVEAPAGLLVVNKPGGLTSHDVVGQVRRLARTRRVGHAGTLDPMATGVLVLGVGRATRLLGHLSLADKCYAATVRLGAATTTDDAEGEIVSRESATDLTEEAVRTAVGRFLGSIDQVPSSVSAVKVDGQRAYARVRSGEAVVLPPRPVTVHELRVIGVRRDARGGASDGVPDGGPDGGPDGVLDVAIEVRCSSGTYVRALARDLGAALGVGGHLTALRRTAVGPVTLAEATPLDALAELAASGPGHLPLLTMGDAARRFFATVAVDADAARAVGHGRRLPLTVPPGRPTAVLGPDGELLALYESLGEAGAKPVAVFA